MVVEDIRCSKIFVVAEKLGFVTKAISDNYREIFERVSMKREKVSK